MQHTSHNDTKPLRLKLPLFKSTTLFFPSFLYQFNFKVNKIHIYTTKTNYNSLLETYLPFSFVFKRKKYNKQ